MIDVFSPIKLQRLGAFAATPRDIKPFIGERTAHAAKDAAINQVANGGFHYSPCRGSGEKNRLLRSKEGLQLRMNVAVKIFKIVTPMADHRPRKCRHRLSGDFDGAGSKKLVVRNHSNKRSTVNVQRSNFESCGMNLGRTDALQLILDKADTAAALHPGSLNALKIFRMQRESQVLFKIMFCDVVVAQRRMH